MMLKGANESTLANLSDWRGHKFKKEEKKSKNGCGVWGCRMGCEGDKGQESDISTSIRWEDSYP